MAQAVTFAWAVSFSRLSGSPVPSIRGIALPFLSCSFLFVKPISWLRFSQPIGRRYIPSSAGGILSPRSLSEWGRRNEKKQKELARCVKEWQYWLIAPAISPDFPEQAGGCHWKRLATQRPLWASEEISLEAGFDHSYSLASEFPSQSRVPRQHASHPALCGSPGTSRTAWHISGGRFDGRRPTTADPKGQSQ